MSDAFIRKLCPLCNCAEFKHERTVLRGPRTYDIVRCRDCEFVFVPRLYSETYREGDAAPKVVPERGRHYDIKQLCDRALLRRHSGARIKVAEIGAGWGGLAKVFSGDDAYEYVGFEPSSRRAEYCCANGLNVRCVLFGPEAVETAMDAIIIDNVLEHVKEPGRLIEGAVTVLKPGGLIIVIVPNLNDLRRFNRKWRNRHHWQPDCHINYFSSRTLRQLFGMFGLRCRFFGLGDVFRVSNGSVLLRAIADRVGLHPFGLNCYAVKPQGSTIRSVV